MKPLLLSILFCLIPLTAFAQRADTAELEYEDKTYVYAGEEAFEGITKILTEDVNNDGKKEYILDIQARLGDVDVPEGWVFICSKDNDAYKIEHKISTGDYYLDFELIDIDKNGIKDIVAKGQGGMHWMTLNIISFKDDKYNVLWEIGSPSGVFFRLDEKGIPTIEIGISLLGEKEDWGYADEPDWEIWTWDGEKFVYTEGKTEKSRIWKYVGGETVPDLTKKQKNNIQQPDATTQASPQYSKEEKEEIGWQFY